MTTHILEVAERMADRIGIIAGGKLIAEGTLDELRLQAIKANAGAPEQAKPGRDFPGAHRRRRESRMSMQPGGPIWFARHELRLALARLALDDHGRPPRMPAARRHRHRLFSIVLHVVAYWMVGRYADALPDKQTLVVITASVLLSWLLMVSQAMGFVTRAFYARLRSRSHSGVAGAGQHAVRFADCGRCVGYDRDDADDGGAIHQRSDAARRIALGGRLWVDRRDGRGRNRIRSGADGCDVPLLWRPAHAVCGADRRRRHRRCLRDRPAGGGYPLVWHDLARRRAAITTILALAPDAGSAAWWPARAALGDPVALAAVLGASLRSSPAPSRWLAPRFGAYATAASGVGHRTARTVRAPAAFHAKSPRRTLRRKEWTLLRRDPWLISQTLMQMLYLIPPAIMLWRSFDQGDGALQFLVPVLVMAAGQLGGGLAWLAISGEDAPDLVATAPVPRSHRLCQDRGGARRHRAGVCAAGRRARVRLAMPRAGQRCRHHHRRLRGNGHSVLVPEPVQTEPVSPPAGVFALRHFRRSLLVDRLGRYGGSGGGQSGLAIAPALLALLVLAGARAMSPRGERGGVRGLCLAH